MQYELTRKKQVQCRKPQPTSSSLSAW